MDAYVKYRRDYSDTVYNLIYSFCPDSASTVLDVGCGTGLVTHHLAGYYKHVTGTDKSPEMIDAAKNIGVHTISFVVAPTERLPFENGSFDLVTAAAAYHWFDYDVAGREIIRVLKPNGKLCALWKYAPSSVNAYLPAFAVENLQRFIPEIPKTNKEPVSKDVFSRVGFTKVEIKEFDFDDVYSAEEILGYVQSHSTFNLLEDVQKEEYKKLNAKSVEEYLTDGNFTFKSRMQIWFIEK